MSVITHIRFYPSDWLAGTRGMSAAETGVYITLIAMMYERCGPIDGSDTAKLARLCGTSASAMKVIIEGLISDGKIVLKDGLLTNRRVELELKNVMSKSEVAREKSNARWAKRPTKTMKAGCSGIAPAILANSQYPVIDTSLRSVSENSPDPESLDDREIVERRAVKKTTPRQALEAVIGAELAAAVLDHRQKLKKPLTAFAAELLAKGFLATGDPQAAARMMIERGWIGFKAEWYDNERNREANGSQPGASDRFGKPAHATGTGRGRRQPPSVSDAFARAAGLHRNGAPIPGGGGVLFDPGDGAGDQPGITIDGRTGARVH